MRPMRSVYSLAWRNLASRRLRTFLTALAIAVGVAAVLATSMIGQAMQVSTRHPRRANQRRRFADHASR